MRKRLKQALTALLCLTGCTPLTRTGTDMQAWAVYYDTKLPASAFSSMDLVVFDRRSYPKFKELKGDTLVLAYVSMGEVYDDVPEKDILKGKKLLLSQHPVWKSHAVDLTSPIWRNMVLSYVDDAASKGFDGVMLDTVDAPLHWAEVNAPGRVDAMREGAAMLIHAIRAKHPKMKIMLNRGFSVLTDVAPDIDYVLAESILANTNVSTGHFELFPPKTVAEVAKKLQNVVALAPHLQVFTLDYWYQDDARGLERIYAMQRAQGFIPYVTLPDLQHFTPEAVPVRRDHR
ncbi:MAG: endo alpha-1,4 polygalactosaminidase [Pseudomonadota bacterium]